MLPYILIDSPVESVCGSLRVITPSSPPSLNVPILLIPETLLPTVKDFSELD